MTEEKENKSRSPDYTNLENGLSVWVNEDKNGNPYLLVRVLGLNLPVFPYKTKKDPPQ